MVARYRLARFYRAKWLECKRIETIAEFMLQLWGKTPIRLILFIRCHILPGSYSFTDPELALDESYDAVRNGTRLVLNYDAQSNSFNGFVENTTDKPLKQVRVEVRLSNGVELGPTTPTDLNPGENIDVSLTATNKDFDGWTAHPEVGESIGREHGGGEGNNEHGEEGESGHTEGDSD